MSPFSTDSKNLAAVKACFARGDAGRLDLFDLFSDDFQFYFPKFGIGRGKAQFSDFIDGLMRKVKVLIHDVDAMQFFEGKNFVVAEGITRGIFHDGESWLGGRTPGGRFCSVYEFGGDGLINRMHVYLDPDYTGQDACRFLWGADRKW
ncbi:nuclear transport factor 2 family protein [Burkholderia sp. Bp9142]|uniref:nuclear transport factor 2 family protein n=1 Tax=Burkholderia sp. Bp9142 TaxID=2184573 RepID=UPI000F5A58AF|nr:nuclear transport factor 2 family protein [Burkholderia sp. Bp9142]